MIVQFVNSLTTAHLTKIGFFRIIKLHKSAAFIPVRPQIGLVFTIILR